MGGYFHQERRGGCHGLGVCLRLPYCSGVGVISLCTCGACGTGGSGGGGAGPLVDGSASAKSLTKDLVGEPFIYPFLLKKTTLS